MNTPSGREGWFPFARWLFPLMLLLIVPGAWRGEEARAAPAAPLAALSGTIRDPAGNLLSGSVVLLTPARSVGETRTASTLEDGRYLFTSLVPGIYRVTALKAGYDVSGMSVNTLLRSTLDLVLRRWEAKDPETLDMDWVLRVPPRDILRDLEAAVPGTSAKPPPSAPAEGGEVGQGLAEGRAGLRLPVDGEFQQWFSSASPISSPDSMVSGSSGSTTSVRLSMRVGERLGVRLAGLREREDARLNAGPESPERLTGGERVGVDVAYELGDLSRLEMQAAYTRDSLLLQEFDQPFLAPIPDSESVSRSLRTDWSTPVGDGGSLDVSGLYVDEVSRSADDVLFGPVVNKLWRADGLFRTPLGDAHVLSFGLRARMLELGGPEARALGGPAGFVNPVSLAGPAPAGWAVHVHGGEEWALTPVLNLDFGVDYHRSLSFQEVSRFLPQAGATFRPGRRTSVRLQVSYLAGSYQQDASSRAADPQLSSPLAAVVRNPIGYELRVERRNGEGTMLGFSASSRPIASEYDGERPIYSIGEERPVYISDGQAQSREVGVEMGHRFGGLGARVESTWGRLEGRYAALLPGEPLQELHEGSLGYAITSVSGSTPRSGTEARVELRHLREASEPGEPEDIRLTSLSVLVSQDLGFIQLGETRWRLMLAYQNNEGMGARTESFAVSKRRILTAEDRVSGGVAVTF